MYVPFDIETTGLTAAAELTVVGFLTDDTYHLFYTRERPFVQPEREQLLAADGITEVNKTWATSETRLLDRLGEFADKQKETGDSNRQNVIITGFNSSNFDLPHIRTRSVQTNSNFPFTGISALDLSNTFRYKFQTTQLDHTGLNKAPLIEFANELGIDDINNSMLKREVASAVAEHGYTQDELEQFASENDYDLPTTTESTLEGLHDILCNDDYSHLDPFNDSEEAVTAYANGRIDKIALHNLADLCMTRDLLTLAQNTVHRTEIKTRPL